MWLLSFVVIIFYFTLLYIALLTNKIYNYVTIVMDYTLVELRM